MSKKFWGALILALKMGLGVLAAMTTDAASSIRVYSIKAENLALYQVLLNTKKNIIDAYYQAAQEGEIQGSSDTLVLINEEIRLFKEIIQAFNEGKSPFLQYKFVSLCNYFRNRDFVEPRHLRVFEEKVEKFDASIQKYLRASFSALSKDEMKLCEKLHEFNEILLSNFLEYKYFDIDIFDHIVDWTIHRPIELVMGYPAAAAGVTLPVAAVFGVLAWNKHQDTHHFDGVYAYYNGDAIDKKPSEVKFGIRDGTTRIMRLEPSVERQKMALCGKHALMNIAFQFERKKLGSAHEIMAWTNKKTLNWACVREVLPSILSEIKEDREGVKQLLQSVESLSNEANYCNLNWLDSGQVRWIMTYEREKHRDEKSNPWEAVYVIADTSEVNAFLNCVDGEHAKQQLKLLQQAIGEAKSEDIFLDLQKPDDIDGPVWKACSRQMYYGSCNLDLVKDALISAYNSHESAFPGLIDKLRSGQPVYFILNLASREEDQGFFEKEAEKGQTKDIAILRRELATGFQHWIACRDDATSFTIWDSMDGQYLLKNQTLQQLCKFGALVREQAQPK